MADKKNKPTGKKRKRPYVAPVLTIAGSLLTMAKSGLMAVNTCCLTTRLRLSRVPGWERRRLMRDLAVMFTAAAR